MAATSEGRQLTEAHRLAQSRLGVVVASQMTDLWGLLDPDDLDATTARWLRAAVPVISSQHQTSARMSARYVERFRAVEGATTAFTPTVVAVPPLEQVTTSLTVTGPAATKAAVARAVPIDEAMILGMSRSSAAALRQALGGGRSTTNRAVRDDPAALGYARATSGDPCSFCAMLASRGPVYSKDTGRFQAHDSCACTNEPVYRRDSAWPPGAREFRDLWDEATAGEGGQAAINAFRRRLNA